MGWEQPGMSIRVVAAVNAINSISSKDPGPVSGGVAHHSLWSENGSGMTFRHVHHLEVYLNQRLSFFQRETHIREEDLRLCHMDVAPRNFMIDPQGRLYLLDWATAGFFPRYFELWAIEFTQTVLGKSFGPEMIQNLGATPEEMAELETLTLVYRYNSRFTGYETNKHLSPSPRELKNNDDDDDENDQKLTKLGDIKTTKQISLWQALPIRAILQPLRIPRAIRLASYRALREPGPWNS